MAERHLGLHFLGGLAGSCCPLAGCRSKVILRAVHLGLGHCPAPHGSSVTKLKLCNKDEGRRRAQAQPVPAVVISPSCYGHYL